jgi:type IV secretory pathway ATPase VirB11/archaellum biosynthesis ATPase
MTYAAAVSAMPEVLKIFGKDWDDPAVEDFFVNGEGCYFVRRGGKTERREAPGLDALSVEAIGALAGHMRGQYADQDKPILDCELPSGERLNMVLAPCTPPGRPSMALRRGMSDLVDLDWLDEQGLWDRIKQLSEGQSTDFHRQRLLHAKQLIKEKNVTGFFKFCVQNRWSIALVGDMGAGKTLDMSAMAMEIPKTPDERIVTVGDSEELSKLPHPNKVSFLYSDGGPVTAEDLIKACRRNLPRWQLFQEIRDGSAFAYLYSILVSPVFTTWHATSILSAFDSLLVMVMMHPAGKAVPMDMLRKMMGTLINVVVHVERDPTTKKFRATDIKFGSELV